VEAGVLPLGTGGGRFEREAETVAAEKDKKNGAKKRKKKKKEKKTKEKTKEKRLERTKCAGSNPDDVKWCGSEKQPEGG